MHFQFCREPRIHSRRWTTSAVLITILFCALTANAQQEQSSPATSEPSSTVQGPYVSPPVVPRVMNKDLRKLELAPLVDFSINSLARQVPRGIVSQPPMPADILQREDEKLISGKAASSAELAPLLGNAPTPAQFANPSPNFGGIGYTQVVPPDPNGAVGPNNYIQTVNSQFAIYDKLGNLLSGPTNINQLWSSTPNDICAQNNNGDPVVVYDDLANRWLITQFAIPNGFQGRPTAECVAVSKTGDPVAGGWFLYTFTLNINHDYPKLSVWPDAYYLSSQQGYNGGALNAIAFDRTNMLAGNAATFQAFTLAGPPTVILLPSDSNGTAPPAGTPDFFARPVDGTIFGGSDRIEIYAFHVDWAVPANSTFTLFNTLTPATFSSGLCNPGNLDDNCSPQPNTTTTLETQAVWPMIPLGYRNFGDHESMVFAHTVNAGTAMTPVAGMRWYELRRPPAGNWSINQQQTYSPDSTFRWMGSVAMDQAGDMALGYSVSSSSLFPSIRYVGRLASDPLSTMTTTEVTTVTGNNSQIANGSRWGDYSAMRVDPADGCTFWYTNQFSTGAVVPDNSAAWGTQISAFRFPTCNPADLALTKTGPATATAGTDVTYTIGITNNGPSNSTNVVLTDTLPANVVLGVITGPNAASCNQVGTTLTCLPGNLANGASISYNITVHVPSAGVGSATMTNTASVTSDQLDPNTANNTASVTTNIVFVADLAITKSGAPNPVDAGTPLTYTIAVTNFGPSDAVNVLVTDTLPAGVNFASSSLSCVGTPLICSLGTIPANSQENFTITVNIPANYLSSRFEKTAVITNTATVKSNATDPNLSNNTASVNTTVIQVADVGVAVSEAPNPVHQGGTVTYTMTFSNAGPSDAPFAQVLQYFPAGFVFAGSSLGTCKPGTKDVLCQFGPDTTVGYMHTFTVTYKVPAKFLGTSTSKTVISQIGVSSQAIDPDPADSTNFVSTTVIK
jgi:uncharacterized repeat protein (TIGR01451 family)